MVKKIKKRGISFIGKTKKEALFLKKEIRKHTTTAIAAAFAFVMALVWRDAIKDVTGKVVASVGIAESTYLYSIVSAIIITVICVMGIISVSKWSVKK